MTDSLDPRIQRAHIEGEPASAGLEPNEHWETFAMFRRGSMWCRMLRSGPFCMMQAVALLALSYQSALAQKDFVVEDLEDHRVLRTLFNAINVDTDDVAVWKPSFAESKHFPISDDGMCHTEIDTIMEYQSESYRNAIVIFSTDNGDDCHACAPMLSVASFVKLPEGWKMREFRKDFEKNGAWGHRQDVRLRQIGKTAYALELDDCYGGQGQMSCGMSLYDAEYLRLLIALTTSDNDLGAHEKGYSWERTIKFVPGKNEDYYDLITTVSGTRERAQRGGKAPVQRVSKTRRYQYENNHYVAAE